MDLTKYRNKLIGSDDERAVSPVIGVILMVAITVILAAVIAAFVLDIGDLDDSAPNSQFSFENNSSDTDLVDITHTSGDDIETGDLTLQGASHNSSVEIDGDGETWTAGQTSTVEKEDDTIRIVWEGDGSSTVIAEYEP